MRIGFFGDSLTEGLPGVSYVDILRERFPSDELENYGRGGDSVIGTYERIVSIDVEGPFDLAFVWTGVNDVLANISRVSPVTRTVLGEPWTRSRQEFAERYRAVLTMLSQIATRIVAVAPLFIGEDLTNEWNRELGERSRTIETLASAFEHVEFLDLRKHLPDVLEGRCRSSYVERSGLGTVWEAIALRDAEDVDRVAKERGLCYTVDGIHLNSRGAEAVAEVFGEAIERLAKTGDATR